VSEQSEARLLTFSTAKPKPGCATPPISFKVSWVPGTSCAFPQKEGAHADLSWIARIARVKNINFEVQSSYPSA
jgi:hypothetical protein